MEHKSTGKTPPPQKDKLKKALDEVEIKCQALFEGAKHLSEGEGDPGLLALQTTRLVEVVLELPHLESHQPPLNVKSLYPALSYLRGGPEGGHGLQAGDPAVMGPLLIWGITSKLGRIKDQDNYGEYSRTWIDEWLLGKIIAQTLGEMGLAQDSAWRMVSLLRTLVGNQTEAGDFDGQAIEILETWLADPDAQNFLMIHRHQGVLWFNKEAFEALLWWWYATSVVEACQVSEGNRLPRSEGTQLPPAEGKDIIESILSSYTLVEELLAAQEKSGYQVEKLLEAVRD